MEQMILAPWGQLGVVGSVVLALGVVCLMQWRHIKETTEAHIVSIKEFGDKFAELITENTKTNAQLAGAIDRLRDRMIT